MKVRLEDVHPRVFVEHVQHMETLVKELRVVASGQASRTAPVTGEIMDVVDGVLRRYARVKDEAYLRALQAMDRGEERMAMEFDLPEGAAHDAQLLLNVLERADEACREQGLLTLPAPPEVARFRRWALPEIARQLRNGVHEGGAQGDRAQSTGED